MAGDRRGARWIALVALCAAGASPTLGQHAPDPAKDPSLADPRLADPGSDRIRPRAPTDPIPPVTEPPHPVAVPTLQAPAPPDAMPGLEPIVGRLYPEGTYLSERRGVVTRAGGELVFIPARPANTGASPDPRAGAMVLLRNQRLKSLEDVLDAKPRAVVVSGHVSVYRDRQYLLLSSAGVPADAPPTPEAPEDAGVSRPEVRELIRALEARRTEGRTIADDPGARAARDAGRPGAKATRDEHAGLLAEGSILTRRRGRLLRAGPDGAFSFVADNDADSPGHPPIPLLACRLVEDLESLASQRGEGLTVRLSGRVRAYKGRNYLMPTMYQALRPGDVTPLQ